MATRFARFLPVFAILLVGCETPDEDWPLGHETIRVGTARFGAPVEVSIAQQTDEWEFCHPRSGEFGPWIDCEETRQREAKLVSIECLPAESCRDVTIDGAKGSFVPVAARFSVHVVGEIEGSRVEASREVNVERPNISLHFSPAHALPGTQVSLCRSGEDDLAITFAVTLDGAPLAAAGDDSSRSGCTAFVPPAPGRLSAIPRLIDPPVNLVEVTAVVHPFSDVDDVEIHDLLCSDSRSAEIGAYLGKDGRYLVSVSAMGMVPTGDRSSVSAYIPASRIRLVEGGAVVSPTGAPELGSVSFPLDAPPGSSARIEVDLDGRTVTAPVRVRSCTR